MKRKLKARILFGLLVLIVLVPILLVVARFANDVPSFKMGPLPSLGEEVGSISPASADQIEQLFKEWKQWKTLSAVKHGHLYAVDPDLILRPGPRIVDGLEKVAKIVEKYNKSR